MSNKCDFCGEVKPVRQMTYMGNYGQHFYMETSPIPIIFNFDYICEQCDMAQKIMRQKLILESEQIKEADRLNWIKKRDKLLNNIVRRFKK